MYDVHIMYLTYTGVGMTWPPSQRVFLWETVPKLRLKDRSGFLTPDAMCVTTLRKGICAAIWVWLHAQQAEQQQHLCW